MAAAPVKDHYERLLGPVYTWMVGDIDTANERADLELTAAGIPAHAVGNAVDLGAGFGLHSLPLARRGYSVLAIDNYQPLLQELEARAGSLAVRAVNSDLLQFRNHVAHPAEVILCMGDTLTHLPDIISVEALFSDIAATLVPGGIFIATFRDYVSMPLQGDGRFILARADENRILSCFLDYSEQTVRVHDVLHERLDGIWKLRVSSYPKLRLAPEWAISSLTSRGFLVRREAGPGGMVRLIAQRAAGK
jgi:SAM-dependent methyltransferase